MQRSLAHAPRIRRRPHNHIWVARQWRHRLTVCHHPVAPPATRRGRSAAGRGAAAALMAAVAVDPRQPLPSQSLRATKFDISASGVATITLSRPKALNALSGALMYEARHHFTCTLPTILLPSSPRVPAGTSLRACVCHAPRLGWSVRRLRPDERSQGGHSNRRSTVEDTLWQHHLLCRCRSRAQRWNGGLRRCRRQGPRQR
eukprot:COSAG01_NODE_10_length_42970_cov_93.010007_46_plen_202_part_00